MLLAGVLRGGQARSTQQEVLPSSLPQHLDSCSHDLQHETALVQLFAVLGTGASSGEGPHNLLARVLGGAGLGLCSMEGSLFPAASVPSLAKS